MRLMGVAGCTSALLFDVRAHLHMGVSSIGPIGMAGWFTRYRVNLDHFTGCMELRIGNVVDHPPRWLRIQLGLTAPDARVQSGNLGDAECGGPAHDVIDPRKVPPIVDVGVGRGDSTLGSNAALKARHGCGTCTRTGMKGALVGVDP